MSNKKQIPLKTIQLDWGYSFPESIPVSVTSQLGKTALFLPSKVKSSTFYSPSGSLQKERGKIRAGKTERRQNLFINRLQQIQINKCTIDKYIPSHSFLQTKSFYQQFPKRQSPIKNGNAFKFFLNSTSAHKNYTESIVPLERIHLKLTEISLRKPVTMRPSVATMRPSTGTMRSQSQSISQLFQKQSNRYHLKSSSLKKSSLTKRQKCQTVPQIEPWETVQDKFLTDW